jgi:hypothetical protein
MVAKLEDNSWLAENLFFLENVDTKKCGKTLNFCYRRKRTFLESEV